MRNVAHASLVLLAILGGACGDDGGTTDGPDAPGGFAIAPECNPLGISHCMAPWPSSAFEVDDATSATGRRLAIPAGTLPTNYNGADIDPAGWNRADGFSPAAPMVMAFPGGVSVTGLPTVGDLSASLDPASATVLWDMTTGERIPHWAELDAARADAPDKQALFIRPGQRLTSGHRFAVGITTRVKSASGGDLPVPAGFIALRDGTPTEHPLLEAMRPRYGAVLDALQEAGVPRTELVVAWDFTTRSDEDMFREPLAARDRAVTALDSHPIDFTIIEDEVEPDVTNPIARKITGTLDAPLFLTNNGEYGDGTKIALGTDGLPALQGFYQIPFVAIVPRCAYTAVAPVPMILYGHGLMGSANETGGGVQRTTAAELCAVFVGTDMRGMSTSDLEAVAGALNNITRADEVMEVLVQGMVNFVTTARAMRTTFATELFVNEAVSVVDPTKVYYYGISQGAIFGTGIMAYEPTITRGALAVGGANYSLLLERSLDWPIYRSILEGAYPDPLDIVFAINLFQMRWDPMEGAGVAHVVRGGTVLGTPPKQLLMQIALGDEQVPNVGSWWLARSLGIPVLGPTPLLPWGIEDSEGPLTSALVIQDGGAPMPPATNTPPEDHEMHNLTRNQPASRRQIGQFFSTGQITNTCDGACVCPAQCM
jgi:hypothetical protein